MNNMDLSSVLSFLGVAILLTLIPGPDNLFVLAQSISNGKKAGILTALGLSTGLIFHITAATLGITAIIYQSAIVFAIVKYAGAAYLLFLAYKSFREKDLQLDLNDESSISYKSLYRKAVISNLLNPKVSLFFLAFLPQFINYTNGNVTKQMLIYGILSLIQSLVIFILISIFSGKLRNYLKKKPTIAKKINLIQGSLFTLIGLKIAFTQK